MRPQMPQQQVPTPGGQEVMQAMPYRQQVFPPKHPAPKPSATPSASQDHRDLAGEAEGARGRSLSRGPRDRQRRSRSSTRGSRKRQWGTPSDSLMDKMANYVASGWKLLLGGPDRFLGPERMARGHHQVSWGNGQTKGQ